MSILLDAAASAADIRDIRGPISLPAQPPWLLYLACAVLAPLALWGVLRWLRQRRAPAPSAYQLALAQLTTAEAELDRQAPDVFAEQVSGAVRRYIETRFALPVTQRTSEEFLTDLLNRADVSPLLAAQRPELSQFLQTCDLAKFAARGLHRETMRALSAAARRFIETAEHPPESQPAAAGVPA